MMDTRHGIIFMIDSRQENLSPSISKNPHPGYYFTKLYIILTPTMTPTVIRPGPKSSTDQNFGS